MLYAAAIGVMIWCVWFGAALCEIVLSRKPKPFPQQMGEHLIARTEKILTQAKFLPKETSVIAFHQYERSDGQKAYIAISTKPFDGMKVEDA